MVRHALNVVWMYMAYIDALERKKRYIFITSLIGTVENVTEKTISRVRVEVHLSNGNELGPTEPIDLAPGKKVDVKLSAEGQSFNWWKAHAEAGASEH